MKAQIVNMEPERFKLDTGSGYEPGQILLANDARYLEAYYSEPVTNYAVGFMDKSDLLGQLQFVAPSVTVGRRFEWKKANNAEEFMSEIFDDQRAIGSDFKRVEYTAQDVTDKTYNKGLTYIADSDNVVGNNWQNEKAGKLTRRLLRNELRRGITLLSSSATNTAKTWDTTAGKNPDQDIKTELVTATNLTGVRPNRVFFGDSAWNSRSLSYEAQNNAGGYAASQMDEAALAKRLMVDEVLVSKARYQSSSAAKSEIVGSKVIAFYAQDDADTEDASHMKRFVSEVEGGGLIRVYVQQLSAKLTAITVEHYSKIVCTFSTGIRQLTIS